MTGYTKSDGAKKLIGRNTVCHLSSPARQWKQLRGQIKLKPETVELVIKVQIESSGATVDFADLKLEP